MVLLVFDIVLPESAPEFVVALESFLHLRENDINHNYFRRYRSVGAAGKRRRSRVVTLMQCLLRQRSRGSRVF
jgi:hypothetical protein